MRLSLLILLLLQFLWVCEGDERIKYTDYSTYRFVPATKESWQMLRILQEKNPGVIFLRQVGKVNQPVDILLPPHMQGDFLKTLSSKMSATLISEDMESLLDHETHVNQLEAVPTDKFDFGMFWDWEKTEAFYDHLMVTHSDLCMIEEYGRTFEGRPMKAIVISSEHPVPADKPVIFMDATTHAREWITTMACCYFLNEMVSNKTEFVKMRQNYVIAASCVANPDGFVYSWKKNRLWRKTRTDNGDLLCQGVDPNRNWGFGHGGEGTSSDKCSDIYRGTGPFSIVETANLSKYMRRHKNIVSYVNMHSYSQMILLNYGCTKDKPPAYPEFKNDLSLANKTAIALKRVHGTEYTFGNSIDILYEACGCSTDWAKAVANVPWTYTFELRDTGTFGFMLPANQIKPSCEETTAALVAMHDNILTTMQARKNP